MRYAVVTGGTSDIGRQIAAELLRENYYVIASFCNDEKGAKDCNAYFSTISGQFSLLKVDLGDHEAIKQFGETIKSIAKSIDIFIGNAGATLRKPFTETTNEEWENIFRINLHANVYLLRDLDKLLVNEANIVFIGSSMAVYPHALSLSTQNGNRISRKKFAITLRKRLRYINLRLFKKSQTPCFFASETIT